MRFFFIDGSYGRGGGVGRGLGVAAGLDVGEGLGVAVAVAVKGAVAVTVANGQRQRRFRSGLANRHSPDILREAHADNDTHGNS